MGARRTVGRALAALALVAVALFAPAAGAHAVGVSRGVYVVEGREVRGLLTFARGELAAALPELDSDGDGTIDAPELEGEGAAEVLRDRVVSRIEVWGDGAPCEPSLRRAALAEGDGVTIDASWTCAAPASRTTVAVRLVEDLSPGHRHLARLRAGDAHRDAVLYAAEDRFTLEAATPAPPAGAPGAFAFLRMGAAHVLTGYDHLLFLVALVLAAAGGGAERRLRSLLAVVTAFTIAHSATLAVAALGLWAPSPRFVEPAIALSIAYVGVENVVLRDPSRRWKLTFVFGLVHGFGFAGALREIALPRGEVPAALLGFNLGVEVGQLAVIALALPLVIALRRSAWFDRLGAQLLSGGIAVAGVCWFVVRVLQA